MNNKTTLICMIIGGVVASLFLGVVKQKREKEDEKDMEESMNNVVDMFNDAFQK